MNQYLNHSNQQKNTKNNDCHMCWLEHKSSALAFCSKRSCRKAFCQKCIQNNYDENYNIRKHYKPEYFICYICQGRCKCTICNGTLPEKFGQRYIKKFLKMELKVETKPNISKKQKQKYQESEEEEEELFSYKGKSFSSIKAQQQNVNIGQNQIANQLNSEDSSSFPYNNIQTKIFQTEQDEETKSLRQQVSQLSYVQNSCMSIPEQQSPENLRLCCKQDKKHTLNRIIGYSINEWYEASNESTLVNEEIQNGLQQSEYTYNSPYDIQQKIKYEEDTICEQNPLSQIKSDSIITQPNVIEESDDSEEEGVISYQNKQKVIKKLILKKKKNQNILKQRIINQKYNQI